MVSREALVSHLNDLLEVETFKDYCPNGLQVEGRSEIQRLACAVTASLAVIEAAVAWGADALLVHHGYFWKGEAAPLVGLKQRRIRALLAVEMNLLAYHLPLDAHPELGNNARWGAAMGWRPSERFGEYRLGWLGWCEPAITPEALQHALQRVLGREPLWLPGDEHRRIEKVAWCSGGADGWFQAAVDAGADAFVTGEVSEPCYHLARESGVHFFAAGHHATERFGVQALGEHLQARFGLEWRFIDQPNPV